MGSYEPAEPLLPDDPVPEDSFQQGLTVDPDAGLSLAERQYRNLLLFVYQDEIVDDDERAMLERERGNLELSPERAEELEQEVARQSLSDRAESLTLHELPVGAIIDRRYLIIELLGRGGLGAVYRVRDTQAKKDYAIKLLRPELGNSIGARESLRREVIRGQDFAHENICRIHHLETRGQIHYIVMEFVDGETLEDRLRKHGALGREEFLQLADQILDALDYLHAKSYIHLDVKPANVMVTEDNRVKLIDYGVTRKVEEQLRDSKQDVAGTWHYMAPEQIRGDLCDARTDIYACGITFFRLLNGRYPFAAELADDIRRWHLGSNAPAEGDTPELVDVFARCMARDPYERFASCEQLRRALHKALAKSPAAAEPPPIPTAVEASESPSSVPPFLEPAPQPQELPKQTQARAATASETVAAVPELPPLSADQAYHEYMSRSGLLGVFNDPSKLQAPLPRHPQNIVAECQRLYASNAWGDRLFGKPTDSARQVARRFGQLIGDLQMWAFFYPQYRSHFVNLWNQTARERRVEAIDREYFQRDDIRQLYADGGPPRGTDTTPPASFNTSAPPQPHEPSVWDPPSDGPNRSAPPPLLPRQHPHPGAPGYRRPPRYAQRHPYAPRKTHAVPHRGPVLIIFAIVSFFMCPPLALVPLIMAQSDLDRMNRGTMDPSGRELTQAARAISIVCLVIIALGVGCAITVSA
jgi:serine/threonine protein kinase